MDKKPITIVTNSRQTEHRVSQKSMLITISDLYFTNRIIYIIH
jgi:hypothetical protein